MLLPVKHRIYGILLMSLFAETAFSDTCPSAHTVVERKISRDYEWTLDERKTLEDVLAVERLYSARLKNNGEFVACYYSGKRGLLRLDAKPEKENCQLKKAGGEWELVNETEHVCQERDLSQCRFETECQP